MVQETVELNLFVPEDAKAKDVEASSWIKSWFNQVAHMGEVT